MEDRMPDDTSKVLAKSALTIQRWWKRKQAYITEVRRQQQQAALVVDSAARLSRVIRGYLARRVASRRRRYLYAICTLQRYWRAHVHRQYWKKIVAYRRRSDAAKLIGTLGRNYLSRKLKQRHRRLFLLAHVLPARAIKIQSAFRGYMVRQAMDRQRDQTESAITLQQWWRARLRFAAVRQKLLGLRSTMRHKQASVIQRGYRCSRARRELLRRRLEHLSRGGRAAKAIQSAWRSFLARKEMQQFRFCAVIERKAMNLTQLKEEREMIHFDMVDARSDLKRVIRYRSKALRRIRELKDMQIEWERRQPEVEEELEKLTPEDIDRGWDEAFITEKHVLHYSLELSVEDILSRKEQVKDYDIEVESLRLELEDLERDAEEALQRETRELETYRQLELHNAETKFAADKAARVRKQRVRWKERSIRRHVIQRHQERELTSLEAMLRANRPRQEVGVLSLAKSCYLQQKLATDLQEAAKMLSMEQQEGKMEPGPGLQQGFDDGVARMRRILQAGTFEFRMPKTDLREGDKSIICRDCGRVECDCHLGGMNQIEDESSATGNVSIVAKGGRMRVRGHYEERMSV